MRPGLFHKLAREEAFLGWKIDKLRVNWVIVEF